MKKLFALTALLTVLLLLAACGANEPDPPAEDNQSAQQGDQTANAAEPVEGLEPVELIVYFLGDGAADNDEVFALINERTSALINTTVRPLFISWADFGTRYPLVFASGEYFDMIYTAHWSYYADQALRGGFYPLSVEMLNTYAPELMAQMPEVALRQARIGENIYMVPNIQHEFGQVGLLVRGDLRRAHGIPEITSLEIFKDYLRAISDEPGIIPFDGGSEHDIWAMVELFLYTPNDWAFPHDAVPFYTFSIQDPTGTMFNFSETQEFHDFLALMREFNELGVWRMDALTNPNSMVDNFMAGRSGSAINNLTTVANAWQEVITHFPEWEPEVIDATFGTATVVNSFISNGFGIRAISQHPERSL